MNYTYRLFISGLSNILKRLFEAFIKKKIDSRYTSFVHGFNKKNMRISRYYSIENRKYKWILTLRSELRLDRLGNNK